MEGRQIKAVDAALARAQGQALAPSTGDKPVATEATVAPAEEPLAEPAPEVADEAESEAAEESTPEPEGEVSPEAAPKPQDAPAPQSDAEGQTPV